MLTEYEQFVAKMWMNTGEPNELAVAALGLAGESAELADKVFECCRASIDKDQRKDVINELGDIQFYIVKIASLYDLSFAEVLLYEVGQRPIMRTNLEAVIKLVASAGIAVERIKKVLRGDKYTEKEVREVVLEGLGKTQHYLQVLGRFFNASNSVIIDANIEKLEGRKTRRGTLRGDGDNR